MRESLARYSIVIVLLLSSVPASAQRTVELIPFAGAFVPLMSFGESSRTSSIGSSKSTFWQTQGVSVGMRARFALSSQAGIEVAGRYIQSGWREDFKVTSGPGIDVGFSLPGSLLVGDVRYTYRPPRSNVYGLLGAGFMSRGGSAWGDVIQNAKYNTSNPTGLLGVGLRASGSSKFQIDATAELLLYSVDKVSSEQLVNGPFKSNAFQSDLLITVGFPITLSGR